MTFCQQNCKPLRIRTFQEKLENLTGANTGKKKWMTNGLLLQIVKKNKKYVEWKSTPITHDNYEQIKQNFKIYLHTVNNIREANKQYFDRIFTAYQSDMKKTWRTINETLNRNKKMENCLQICFMMV